MGSWPQLTCHIYCKMNEKNTHWLKRKNFNVQIYAHHVIFSALISLSTYFHHVFIIKSQTVILKLGRKLQWRAWFILVITYSTGVYRLTTLKKGNSSFVKEKNISLLNSSIIHLSNSLCTMPHHPLSKTACF